MIAALVFVRSANQAPIPNYVGLLLLLVSLAGMLLLLYGSSRKDKDNQNTRKK